MSFRVETTQPCLKPNQTPYSYRSPYYPLENDRANECTEEINTQLDSDSRYTKLGSVSVSEYDIQSSSGVLTKLKDLQLASKYVGQSQITAKKMIPNYFYSRPTIPWKLECELNVKENNLTIREEIIEMIEYHTSQDYKGATNLALSMATCWSMTSLVGLFCGCAALLYP